MIESCCRSGGLVGRLLMWPPPEAPWPPEARWTEGFDGARKINAAPLVISRTRLPPPVMSWAITLATVRPIINEIRGKKRFFMLGYISSPADYTPFYGENTRRIVVRPPKNPVPLFSA